ncbi:MAG: PIG-L family deacetylase [Betaproteobacteria bacterium]|nr:PIG-L family deacetylase [Betaproteobacteria bacterium]
MTFRKDKLLKHHRRKKRVALVLLACLLIAVGFQAGIGWVLPLLVLAWIAHEAWFSDHLFYAPDTDYVYQFDERLEIVPVDFSGARLSLAADAAPLGENDTLILAVTLRSSCLGRLFDPFVQIEAEGKDEDRQTFERGAKGVRYLNLTGFAGALRGGGVWLRGRHCCLQGTPRLLKATHPDYWQKRLLVVAPHADDAELAAFGLYSQAKEAWVVTLTAGETKARHYQRMGLEPIEAARIKGRLRAWDSLAVPLWAGVPAERTVQLGYFCLQLSAMRASPAEPVASSEADLCDTRFFRARNRVRLESDCDGVPSWNNLIADLREIILLAKPEAIVLPHPLIDPHPDHAAASEAVREALKDLAWQPEVLLHYVNHLSDTDRWPMGEAHSGVALPPLFENVGALVPWVLPLGRPCQIDKAMALGMMHDLTVPLSFKERHRRALQRFFVRRRLSPFGADDFFRRAVRRHELFWVKKWTQ